MAFWTFVGSSREAILDLVDKHHDATAFEQASTLAWTQAQVQLYHLDIHRDEAALFQRLAGHLIYAAPALRASSETIARGPVGSRDFGRWGSPAICRSCCYASPNSSISISFANCCARLLADEAARG